jgi:hypothetical protein
VVNRLWPFGDNHSASAQIDVAYLRDIRLDRDPCPAQPLDGSNRLLRLLFALE